MAVFVLVNVGSRDVQLDGQPQNPARERGAEILGMVDTEPVLKERLSFPILRPPLEQILAEEGQIDQLILFGTDQEDEKHQAMDTINFAKIVALVMSELFPQIRSARHVPIRDINPSLYDEALGFFREELPRLHLSLTDDSKVYLLPTAGTPACSLGLILQGLTFYGERCHILYQRYFMKEVAAKALPIGARLQETFQRQTAVHLLRQFNFQAAAQACKSAGVQNKLVEHLLT